jgi:transcriptional regulator with XRE-family HTH domain
MVDLGSRLRARARELELSDAEVARRAGLGERRYGHYVRNRREPDVATLLRICAVLGVTPNDLLLETGVQSESPYMVRLLAAARKLSDDDLRIAASQVEALTLRDGKPRLA